MARAFGKLKGTVWSDDDWKQLDPTEQWAYVMLLSQPQINNCGVLPYVVTRWARLAKGLTIVTLGNTMRSLDRQGFVVMDEETAEVLVRTFIKHDEVEKQPNLVKAAKRQYGEIQSPVIRGSLHREYPHLFEPLNGDLEALQARPLPEPLSEGLPEPLSEGVENGFKQPSSEGVPEGVSNPHGRARDLHLHGNPLPSQQTASIIPPNSGTHDDEITDRLRAIGWSEGRISIIHSRGHLELASRWIDHAEADPTIENVGAYSFAMTDNGAEPPTSSPQQSTLAPGALGATHSARPKKLPHECRHPNCGSTFKTKTRLDEHTADCHTQLERAPLPPAIAALVQRATPPSPEAAGHAPPPRLSRARSPLPEGGDPS